MVVPCVSHRDEAVISMLPRSQHRRRSIGAAEDGGNVGIGKGGSHSLDRHEAKRRVRFRTGSARRLRVCVRRRCPDTIECPIHRPKVIVSSRHPGMGRPRAVSSDPVIPGALPN